MRSWALAAGLLLTACGSTLAGASSAAPSAAASPTATRGLPGALPGSAVHITVNGAPYDQNVPFQLQPTGRPVVIEMAFPFAVDRPSLQTWIPVNAAALWVDERTLRLTYPETETNIGFKIPETRAADGSAVISFFIVRVDYPASRVVSTYTVAELLKGASVPTPATTVRVSAPGSLKVSPDGRHAIASAYGPPAGLVLVDLTSRTSAPLTGPTAADGAFVFADWLGDGRLLVVGRTVWIGNGDGGAMRRIADALAALGAAPSAALPDPNGKRVALTGSVVDGHVALLDLGTASVARITGRIREYVGAVMGFDGVEHHRYIGGGSWWMSPDTKYLAQTEPSGGAGYPQITIIELATGRSIAAPVPLFFVGWLADDRLAFADGR